MARTRTGKATQADNNISTRQKPQKRTKNSELPTRPKQHKKASAASRRDPRVLLPEAHKALDAAIDDRKEAQKCCNETQQHRSNMYRERDVMKAWKGLNSVEAAEAEAKVVQAEEEVDGAKEWVQEMLDAEEKCGSRLNALWELAKLIGEEEAAVKGKSKEAETKGEKVETEKKQETPHAPWQSSGE
ncbi:hypothetical protein BST61_g7909 [Cercospora zeina]